MRIVVVAASFIALTACASSNSDDRVREGSTTISTRETTQRLEGLGQQYEVVKRSDQILVSHPVPASLEKVWQVLPTVYQELGIDIQTLREDTWELGNESQKARRRLGSVPLSRIAGCGGVAGLNNADTYAITLFIVTKVNTEGDGFSSLQTRVEAQGVPPGTSQPPVVCRTTGWLEGEIARRVRTKVMS